MYGFSINVKESFEDTLSRVTEALIDINGQTYW